MNELEELNINFKIQEVEEPRPDYDDLDEYDYVYLCKTILTDIGLPIHFMQTDSIHGHYLEYTHSLGEDQYCEKMLLAFFTKYLNEQADIIYGSCECYSIYTKGVTTWKDIYNRIKHIENILVDVRL